jgi:hypothetical protein
MVLAGAMLWFAGVIYRVLGATGTRVVQRVTLLLAAIAVMTRAQRAGRPFALSLVSCADAGYRDIRAPQRQLGGRPGPRAL